MKIQSLLLAFLFFTIFSCDKKETEPEVRYLQTLSIVFGEKTITYSYAYNDNMQISKIIEHYEGPDDNKTITTKFTYDSENRICETEVSDGTNISKVNLQYQSDCLILSIPGSDEALAWQWEYQPSYFVILNGKVTATRSCLTCPDLTKYTWNNYNISKFEDFEENSTTTMDYDDKINPLNFAPGISGLNNVFDELGGLPFFFSTKNNVNHIKGDDYEYWYTYTYINDYPIAVDVSRSDDGDLQIMFDYY